jgi:hypothetical protein
MPGKRMRQLIKQEPGESCAEQAQGEQAQGGARMEGDDDDDHRSPEVCDVDARGEELQAQLLRANVQVQAAALLGIEQMRESREELAAANGTVALLQEDARARDADARAKDAEVRTALHNNSALEVRVASLESALRAKCQQLEECSFQLERLAREVDAKDALIRRLQAEAQRAVKTEPRDDDDVKPGVAAAALVAPADSGSSSGSQRPASCVRANGPGFINMFGSEGKAKGKLKYPQKIIIDADGNYIVADAGNVRACIYTRFLFDSFALAGNGRIQVFRSSDCACLRIIGKAGSEAGQFNYPSGVALDGSGHLIVADQYNHRVQVLRYADGSHVRTIGCMGSAPGEFKFPDSVVVDGSGHLLVRRPLPALRYCNNECRCMTRSTVVYKCSTWLTALTCAACAGPLIQPFYSALNL